MVTFGALSYMGNPNLWGCPLEKNCSPPLARVSPPSAVALEEKRGESFEFLLYWICFGLSVGAGFAAVVLVVMWKLSWRIRCVEVMDRMIESMDEVICMLSKLKPKPIRG